jgi:hypothetical protein
MNATPTAATEASSPTAPPAPAAPAAKSQTDSILMVRGSRFVIGVSVVLALTFVGNLVAALHNKNVNRQRKQDALVANTASDSSQKWLQMKDGMLLTIVPKNAADSEATTRIRRYLKFQRTEYLRANYSHYKFGNDDIPGRADLEFGTSHQQLNVRYADTETGGSLRWITTDSIMLDSLNEWATKIGTSKPTK